MATKIPKAIADLELSLASSVSVGATSFTLSSSVDDDGTSLPAGLYCFTVDSGTSNKEYLIGQVNGVNVTSVKSVSRQGVETTGAARAHRVGAPCIVTDFAVIQRVADVLNGDLALDGASPIIYDAEPTLADRKELATVGYVLDTVTGGTVTFDQQVITGTAGETFSAGSLVYFKTSDQEWYMTDADTASTVEGVQLGIALGSGSNGVAISGGIQISGTYTTTGLTAGSLYYASNTAGAISTSAGTTSQIVGLALSTTKLLLIPRNPQTPTTNEKAALVGFGTPSSSNTFVTKSKFVKSGLAGATINGATLPVPVYQNKTDNEFYACDANDTNAMKYIGFAITNGVDGGSIDVQTNGIVSGFTGLSEGEKYYVQDTAGTIGTTIGTYEILVGIAISETELLIQKGRRHFKGGGSVGDIGTTNSTQDITITCGFRPSVIRLFVWRDDSASSDSTRPETVGTYSNGTYSTLLSDGTISTTILGGTGASSYHDFTVQSISDTQTVIRITQKEATSEFSYYYYELEGEL